ncbi:MAG: phenylalanine--tRNA ligase subunit beta [Phycisphaerae bacterium]
MLISLNWIRDYVDLPAAMDPRALAERFTRTTAEVDDVRPVDVDAAGLIAARIVDATGIPGTRGLRVVCLDIGAANTIETVSAAPVLPVGASVLFAPPGARVAAIGRIEVATVAGRKSEGMILPGESVGIAMAMQEAILLPPGIEPGERLDPAPFNDWVFELDNKSITNRPDLWGHYGVAREIAAILRLPLKPYPVVPVEDLTQRDLEHVPITIADPSACPRYTGIVLQGVPTRPGPLWLQLRLGHVGLRPISALVDLTNYVMADLGQPMHAFDGDKVQRIEVDWAHDGEVFRTLDGVDRTLTTETLMIKSGGKSIALAGVMGGLDTEVADDTVSLLLESANFSAAAIRRTATRLGLRTDASARFEKSLDPAGTVLAIQRFIHLAAPEYPELAIVKRLSDAHPQPPAPRTIRVNPRHIATALGRSVSPDAVAAILTPLGFHTDTENDAITVTVPSFRATADVTIEVDVIEEIARYVGYDTIDEAMPRVTARRFEPNALHDLEQRTLRYFTTAQAFHEVQRYLWYDTTWLRRIGFDPGPCVELSNPAADGLHRLRQTLMPGLLAAVTKNRFHFAAFSIIEFGSVFHRHPDGDQEHRHFALCTARRDKRVEDDLVADLKADVEAWAWNTFGRAARFAAASDPPAAPWASDRKTASIEIDAYTVGTISVIDLALRRAMDEHLTAWSIAWAEIRLTGLENLQPETERLATVPPHPRVELDFSILVPTTTNYAALQGQLRAFEHPLLKRIRYVASYRGKSIGEGMRSLTFRVVLGHDTRTLVDKDAAEFSDRFEDYIQQCGHQLRK